MAAYLSIISAVRCPVSHRARLASARASYRQQIYGVRYGIAKAEDRARAEEVRQGQKVNVISFSLPTSGMVFSRSLGDF